MINNKPTELTSEDIDQLINQIMPYQCVKCSKKYIHSYGQDVGECDECWFARFPKEEREAFCRSFFE